MFISIKVAATIATGIVSSGVVTLDVVFAALIGAIPWNLITWAPSLPSSSSHALIGVVVAATIAASGSSDASPTPRYSSSTCSKSPP